MKIRSVAENLLESITPCNTTTMKGSGSISDPYVICSVAQFKNLESAKSEYYAIGKDLDFTNSGFEGISNPFIGSLDGRNHTLSGFQTTDQTKNDVALFAEIQPDSTVENLVISGFKVSGNRNVGALVSSVTGVSGHPVVLKNIVMKDSVVAGSMIVGGLVAMGDYLNASDIVIRNTQIVAPTAPGLFSAYVMHSAISDVQVEGQVVGSAYVGGFIGYSDGNTISKVAVFASVNVAQDTAAYSNNGMSGYSGGFFGLCQGNQVSKSYFIGELVNHSTNPVDGLGQYCGMATSGESVQQVYVGARTAYDVNGSGTNLNGILGFDASGGSSSFSDVYIYDHNYMFPNEQSTGVSDLSFSQMNTFSSFAFTAADWKSATATAFRFPILATQTSSAPFESAAYSSSKSLPLVVIETEVNGYAFDDTTRGSSYLSTFVVKNLGSTPIYLDSIFTGGLMNGSFVMESGASAGTCAGVMSGGLALTQNQSCTVGVRVKPDTVMQTGVIYDALNIAYRIGNVKQKVLHGLDAPITVVRPYVTDDTVNFNGTVIGSTDLQDYTIQNTGANSGTIVSYSLASTPFTLDDVDCPVGTTLNVGDTCDLHFQFAPTVAATYSVGLTITMEDPNGFQYTTTLTLSGVGRNRPFNDDPSALCQAADGSVAHPYCIYSREDLGEIKDFLTANYIQTNDIDLGGCSTSFNPISAFGTFSGTFDGQNHEISNFCYEDNSSGNASLFGTSSGTVKNLVMSSAIVRGSIYVAVVVAKNSGNITNVHVTSGTVYSNNGYGGGVSGQVTGGVVSYSSARVTTTGTGAGPMGGLVGFLVGGDVKDSFALSTMTGTKFNGGLVGYNVGGTIQDSYAVNSSITTSVTDSGGLVGYTNSVQINTYAYTTSMSSVARVGGYTAAGVGETITSGYFNDTVPDSGWGTALDSTQMVTQGSYVGFDFTAGTGHWKMPSVNPLSPVLAPVLAWQCGSDGIVCP